MYAFGPNYENENGFGLANQKLRKNERLEKNRHIRTMTKRRSRAGGVVRFRNSPIINVTRRKYLKSRVNKNSKKIKTFLGYQCSS